LFWQATHPVSERLVELLAPRPGQTIVDLAAGPGDTGFLAAPLVRPGGRLVTTDVAPEMLAAARRRAAELGLDDVEFQVEDAAALSFADASVDGILCRWGLMLVPDMGAAAGELRRVLRPGGRAALAVWAAPDANDWMTAPGRSALELGLVERPDPSAPGPFRLSEDGALSALLDSAGLVVETEEDVPIVWRSSSLDEWWDAVRDTSRMLATLLARLTSTEAQAVREGAERRLAGRVAPDGSLTVPGLAKVALAVRPG
jgi:SAM-dependent methyltransferase